MALISINDLPQSDDLDREAMRSIVGGARTGARPMPINQAAAGGGRIVEYPPGFSRQGPSAAKTQPAR
jgi:N-methylhydantoinase A/oxoprolinase/acetone carboxylase beta subunit